MLIDSYKRKIDYLRISVTDRCNLRCIYCMPEYGILQKAPGEILTFEEIISIAELAVSIGINKVKITGGEPLLRKDLPALLQMFSSLLSLEDLSLTTNGILLQRYIKELKKAGLKRLNISIDTLDARKFRRITKFGDLKDVLKGIDAALSENFFIKLNVVIMKGLNDDEILRFIGFAQEKQIIIRFIELMPMADDSLLSQDFYMSSLQIKERLELLGNLKAIVSEGLGNGPAQYYKIEGASIIVGFISPISRGFCFNCNRLRLTSDGLLIPCLNSRVGLDLKGPLRENKEEVLRLIKEAVLLKPQAHDLAFVSKKDCLMSYIGG